MLPSPPYNNQPGFKNSNDVELETATDSSTINHARCYLKLLISDKNWCVIANGGHWAVLIYAKLQVNKQIALLKANTCSSPGSLSLKFT